LFQETAMPARHRNAPLACLFFAASLGLAAAAPAQSVAELSDEIAGLIGPGGRAPADLVREVEVTADRTATRYRVDYRRAATYAVGFERDSAALAPQTKAELKALGRALASRALAGERYLIAGHADATGPEEHNLELSYRRARAVRDHLVEAFGIDPKRLVVAGWGSSRPLDRRAPNDEANRRVEVALIVHSVASRPAGRMVRQGGPGGALAEVEVATIDLVGGPSDFEAGLRGLPVRPAPRGCVQPTHDLDDFQTGGPILGCIPVRSLRR